MHLVEQRTSGSLHLAPGTVTPSLSIYSQSGVFESALQTQKQLCVCRENKQEERHVSMNIAKKRGKMSKASMLQPAVSGLELSFAPHLLREGLLAVQPGAQIKP